MVIQASMEWISILKKIEFTKFWKVLSWCSVKIWIIREASVCLNSTQDLVLLPLLLALKRHSPNRCSPNLKHLFAFNRGNFTTQQRYFMCLVMYCIQISLLILNEFKRIKFLPLNSAENRRFYDDFKSKRS